VRHLDYPVYQNCHCQNQYHHCRFFQYQIYLSVHQLVYPNQLVKCFHSCGFNFHDLESVSSEEENFDQDDEVPLSALKLLRDIFGIDYHEIHA
jgi:hypothetical protein